MAQGKQAKSLYADHAVEYRSGVKRIFHERQDDLISTASFYVPSFGRIVKIDGRAVAA